LYLSKGLKKLKKRKIVRDAALYSSSLFLTRFLISIRGIAIPKFLGPAQYGIYNGLLIIPEYLLRVHLGTLDALKREIPFCYGRKDFNRARLIRNTVFFQYLCTTTLSILLVLLISFLIRDHFPVSVFYSLVLICLWVFFLSFETFFDQVIRTESRFDILSRSEVFKSTIGLIAVLILIWFWGLYGLLGSLILASILKAGYIYVKLQYKAAWEFDFKELKRLTAIGFPIFVGGILYTVFYSVDRFIIIGYLEGQALGYYALALTVLNFLLIIQNGTYSVLEPKIYMLYGEKEDLQATRQLVLEALSGMTLFFPLILGLTYIAFPLLVLLFLPQYSPSITSIRIMVLGSFFFIFQSGTYNLLVAINRQTLIVKVVCLSIGVCYGSSYFLIGRGWGIEGVALSTMGANALAGIIFLLITLSLFVKEGKKKCYYLAHLFFPFVWVAALLMVMDHFWSLQGEWREDLFRVILKTGILFLFMVPFLWRLKKKIKAFQESGPRENYSEA